MMTLTKRKNLFLKMCREAYPSNTFRMKRCPPSWHRNHQWYPSKYYAYYNVWILDRLEYCQMFYKDNLGIDNSDESVIYDTTGLVSDVMRFLVII